MRDSDQVVQKQFALRMIVKIRSLPSTLRSSTQTSSLEQESSSQGATKMKLGERVDDAIVMTTDKQIKKWSLMKSNIITTFKQQVLSCEKTLTIQMLRYDTGLYRKREASINAGMLECFQS
jgi:hypothetical protein